MRLKINRLTKVLLLIGFSVLTQSSCSLFTAAKPAQTTYVIHTVPAVAVRRMTSYNLMVLFPETIAVYNTPQMAYTNELPFKIAYFSRNSWAALPAQMLHPLIVQTLQSTHHFHAILTSSYSGIYDYALSTQILKFQQDFLCSPSQYEIVLRVQLVKAASNKVIATKLISVSETAPQASPYGGVIAANCAVAKALEQIASFTVQHIR